MSGEMFLALQTRYTEDADKTPFVVCRMDAFVDLKNPGVDLLARAFSSAIGKVGDSNFEQTLAFIDSVSQAIEANPQDFAMVAMGLQGLSPDARRLLAAKAERVGMQARARATGQLVEYQLLPKKNMPVPTYARILSRGTGPLGEHAVATSQPLPGPRPSYESQESYATSGLNARNSSLGRAIAFNRESEPSEFDFALSEEEDFESTIDWDDEDPGVTAIYSSSGEPIDVGTSVAKVGAKPSTRANAMNILDEQESRVAPSYSQAYAADISSDEDDELFNLADLDEDEELDEEDVVLDSDEFALDDEELGEEEIEEEEVEVVNKATRSLVALPYSNARPNAMTNKLPSTVVAAKPLTSTEASTDDEDEELDEEPIMLVFPDEVGSEDVASDAPEPDFDEAPLTISADETESETDDVALDAGLETTEEASDEEGVAFEAAEEPGDVERQAIGSAPKQKNAKDSIEIRNQNFGWTPGELNSNEAPSKKVDRVAMRIESNPAPRVKTSSPSAWNRASDDKAQASVPSKFVTRRYARAEVSGAVQGKAKTLATFNADWQEPEEVKQINPVDVPTFKRPE